MSATSPTSPFDQLGLDAPFSEGNDEVDRYESGPAWNELGESPFAEAPASEGSWQEGPERLQADPEDEGLAWLDMEAADANAEAFGAEDLALDGEALHEHEHLHENEDEALLDDTECESGYLDADAERFESEIWADSAEQIAFRNRVLAAHIASKGRAPFPDLSSEQLQTLENVPGTKIKTLPATAAAAGRLLDAANADLARAQQAGDADALRTIRLSVISGHRSSQVQKGLWLRYFSAKGGYYDTTQVARERLPDGPHSDQAVRYMLERQDNGGFGLGGRIAAPGYSNHQNGIAIDFSQERRKGHGIRNKSDSKSRARWRSTWFHHWLRKNAKIFFFQPLKTEEWHWEYHPPGLKARFEGATRGELGQEARGGGSVASWEQANEESLYSEAEYAEEGAVPAPFLRTFTAKALGVKVAVYVTQAARAARQVEMLVFAHGLDLCKPVFKNRPATFITERPFKLGELVEATGRPIVLVVPFLDWERLAANRMAFGRKWHRLAQPANFNQVAAEALEHARAITGSAAPPTLRRLILAGHSRAYGFFDALAHEHASPQMRTGALACPTHVWALDTTYSAPIADWCAWLRSREDLQATVVFRHGQYQTKGSTVVRELATGIRGREFMKLAAASNGRLTVMPVAAGKVSHCAIPTAYLPRLLATLPALATSDEHEAEAQYEEFEEGEDYAGLATEAEALASEDETISGEWTEQPANEEELDAPDRFDAFGDERDSEWGAESSEEAWEAEYEAIAGEEEGRALEAGEESGEELLLAEDEQSKRRTHPQDDVKTDLWSIAFLSSVGGGKMVGGRKKVGGGGAIALFDLFNRTTNRAHRMSVTALALPPFGKVSGLPVGLSFMDSGYVKFKTKVPVSFADFHNRWARLHLKDRIIKSWRSVTIYQRDKKKELMRVEVDNLNLSLWHGFKGSGKTAIHRGDGRPAGNPDYELHLDLPAKEDVLAGFKVSSQDFGLVIRAPGDVLFDFDTDWLHYEADPRLGEIIRYINALPTSYARISVEGHTDSIEKTPGYNLALSKRRAQTVLNYFSRNKWAFNKDYAFDAARGFGATKPIAPNKNPDGTDNPAGRAKNRRVEIFLYKKAQQELVANPLEETKEEALAKTKTLVGSDAQTGADDVDGYAKWYQFAAKGTRIVFEAMVYPIQFDANTRVATGSIRFTVSVRGTSSVDLGIVRMVDGKASVSTSALPVGRHIVYAHYHPDTTEFRESSDQFELRIE